MPLTITLVKPLKQQRIRYQAEELRRDASSILVRAIWTHQAVDVGLFRFEPGDTLLEWYYADRWYNIFRLHAPDGRLKGWYCNVTRPAVIGQDVVESEDLELDLLVSPDRQTLRLDDEEEFAARRLADGDPPAFAAALAAVDELRALAVRGEGPFATTDSYVSVIYAPTS